MRDNTPPRSPLIERSDEIEEDELVFLGDADEVLEILENQINAAEESDDEADGEELEEDLGPSRDDAAYTFVGHTGPVFCGSLHPTEKIAVTGGEDDKAFVWSTDNGDIVFEVTGHNDSIIAADFSTDGNYLVTGDMAGHIQVFKVSQDYALVWEFDMGDMIWLQWHPAANVLLAGAEAGETYVWRIPTGDCKVLQGNGDKSMNGVVTADGKRLVVGYGDGTVKLWDIKTSTVVQDIVAGETLAHTEAVISSAADPDNGIFLTGGEDGKILISSNTGPLSNLYPAAGTVEALAFSNEGDLKLVACGTLRGKVSLWDISKQAVRAECENDDPTGITKILWAPTYTLLCGTLDGSVRAFDGRNGQHKVNSIFIVVIIKKANQKHNLFKINLFFNCSSTWRVTVRRSMIWNSTGPEINCSPRPKIKQPKYLRLNYNICIFILHPKMN